jgi:hypothetical protein
LAASVAAFSAACTAAMPASKAMGPVVTVAWPGGVNSSLKVAPTAGRGAAGTVMVWLALDSPRLPSTWMVVLPPGTPRIVKLLMSDATPVK